MTSLVRTAPVAVCGVIDKYGYDRENDVFTMSYNQDKEYSLPTEIYVHKKYSAIECDAEYTVEPIADSDAAILKIKGNPGEHSVTIKF